MSELMSIWNDTQLRAAAPPSPFAIPNNPNARSIKVNNQSRYWLIVFKTNSNIDVDRIEPFSYLTIPFEKDLSLRIDQGNAVSSLQADKMFVDYSTIDGGVIVFSKGSTQFNGSSSVTINGSVTIANSSLNVAIQGTPTFNLAAGTSVNITGTPTFNVGTMPAINLAAGTSVNITGTPTFNVGTMPSVTIGNATLNVKFDQTSGNNAVTISGTPNVTIANSSVTVSIAGTPTFNLAAGTSVNISGTPTFNVGTMPNVTIANTTLNVALSGTNTVNIGTMPTVTIANSSLNVSVQGTPTFNLAAGTSVNVASGTITVSSANATIVNQQLPITQIYNSMQTFVIPAGTTSINLNYSFLTKGNLANIHHFDVYISSPNTYNYTVAGANAFAIFADNSSHNASANYSITYNGFNSYSLDGNAVICNNLSLTVTLATATAVQETITVYYAIDSNETSIGTVDGVIVKPYSMSLKDASGTVTNASAWNQVLVAVQSRRYIFFQNMSSYDMYILIWGSQNQPAYAAPGSIYVPPNGGSFVMESMFAANDYLFVGCATSGANAKYTCRYY